MTSGAVPRVRQGHEGLLRREGRLQARRHRRAAASRAKAAPRAAREKARAFRHQDNVLGNEKTHLAGFPIARSAKSWAMPARFAEFSIKIDPGLLGKLCALS